MTPKNIIDVGEGFWNVRGPLRVLGVLPVGTHASLVRRRSGKYVLLDACSLEADAKSWVDQQTSGGEALEAILHLHPFHTLFAQKLHELYPHAKLYGTARHHRLFSNLPWESDKTEDPALHALFAEDFDFSVPRGVDFIPSNERLHFSSVLAFHKASSTLHVDDTLNYVRLPKLLRSLKKDVLGFHPSLGSVLERRAGAAKEFRAWVAELLERSRSVQNLCAAHTSTLLARHGGAPISARIELAAKKIERRIATHESRFG